MLDSFRRSGRHSSVMDWEQIERRRALRLQGTARGTDLRNARFDARWSGGRSATEVHVLRQQAAESATLCADCFTPLAPTASVTMVKRRIVVPRGTDRSGRAVPEQDEWLRIPICLTCWLFDLEALWLQLAARGRDHNTPWQLQGLMRFRCEVCRRPMRWPAVWPWRSRRVCCADCSRKVDNEYNRLRRRVRHRERPCAACGVPFLPKRSDAVTCSNTCRQSLHRQRHSSQSARKRSANVHTD
jgi:hypothetical protein